MSGDLVFSDKAAGEMSSALGMAAASIVGLNPSDPSGYELGAPSVTSEASDLFIGLHAFAQGLSVGIAHCEKTISATGDSIAIFDKQLEAAAPTMATTGKTNPFKRSEAAPGPLRTGTKVSITNMDTDSVGGLSKHRTTWKGDHETKTETKRNVLTGESSDTASDKDKGATVTATHTGDAVDGSSTDTVSSQAHDGSSITITTNTEGDGSSHTYAETTPGRPTESEE